MEPKGDEKPAPNLRCFCATVLITFGIVLAPKMKLFEPKMVKKRDVERGACEKGGIGVHMVKPTLLHRLSGLGPPKTMPKSGKTRAGTGAWHSIAV